MTCVLMYIKVAGSLRRKEEIEGFVEEITEKIKRLLTDELLDENNFMKSTRKCN